MATKLSPHISKGKPLFTNEKFGEKVRGPKKFSKTMATERRSPSSYFGKLEVNTTPIIPNRLSDQSVSSTKSPGAGSFIDDKENSQDEEDPITQKSPKKRLSFGGRSPKISKKKLSALSENVLPFHESEEEIDTDIERDEEEIVNNKFDADGAENEVVDDEEQDEDSSLESDSSKPVSRSPKILLQSLNLSPIAAVATPSLLKSPEPKQSVSKPSLTKTTPTRKTATKENNSNPARKSPRNKVSNTSNTGDTMATKNKDNRLQRSMEIQAGSTHVNRIRPVNKKQQTASAIPKRLTRSKCEASKNLSIASFIRELNKTLNDSDDIDSILSPTRSRKQERQNLDSSPRRETKTKKKIGRPRKIKLPSNDAISSASENIHFDIEKNEKNDKEEIRTMLSNSVPLPESEDVTITHALSTTLNTSGKRRKRRRKISMPIPKYVAKVKEIVKTAETTVKGKSENVEEFPLKSKTKRKGKTVWFAPEPSKGNASSTLPKPNVFESSSENEAEASDEETGQVIPSINRSQSRQTKSSKKQLTPYPARKKKKKASEKETETSDEETETSDEETKQVTPSINQSQSRQTKSPKKSPKLTPYPARKRKMQGSDVDDSEDQEETNKEREGMDVKLESESSPRRSSKQIKSQKKLLLPHDVKTRRKRESSPEDEEANNEGDEGEINGEKNKVKKRGRPKKSLNQQSRRSPLKRVENMRRKEKETNEEDEIDDKLINDTRDIFKNEKLAKKPSRKILIKNPKKNKFFKSEEITAPPYDVKFKPNPKSDDYMIYRYFNVHNVRTGHMVLFGGRDKGWNRVKNDSLMFYVLRGPLLVHIDSEQWTAITGEFFQVPDGCDYNLVNPTSGDCRLFFVSCPVKGEKSSK